ncbi:hypothetical protein [Clostridium ljungdahlii]|uniref:Uncharacterized protein n=1 Tax=Clostridium ljungdahlii (strain ATCC 55383 / DSM 13528 / PETC) TaxID=748727 RepID=D8GQ86_CLOLD|nr:hypothetical protein [Clostridium ljungdahlii]ADK16177.1 hypothetical protein CLJU_c31290 [Clostridium ljungdahlii DSM 13528]OAA89954.1 hypothetical protein WX45_01793 [Clostridium ljungdahlii DSM 13528]
MATNLDILKFNLQEKEYPYFDDEDLQLLLDKNSGDVQAASYEGCLKKAVADDALIISGITLKSNREYWLGLAKQFKPVTSYNTSMKRADGQ